MYSWRFNLGGGLFYSFLLPCYVVCAFEQNAIRFNFDGSEILSLTRFSDNFVVVLTKHNIYLIDSNDLNRIFDSKYVNIKNLSQADVNILSSYAVLLCSNQISNGNCIIWPILSNDKKFGMEFPTKFFDKSYESFTAAVTPTISFSNNNQTDLFYSYTWKVNTSVLNLNTSIIRKNLFDPTYDSDQTYDGKELLKSTDFKNPPAVNVYAFVYNNYAYFLKNVYRKNYATNGEKMTERAVKLSRVCLGDRNSVQLRSLASLPLSFDDGPKKNLSNKNSNALSAYFDETTSRLYVFVESLGFHDGNVYLFAYDMKTLDKSLTKDFYDCYTSPDAYNIAIMEPETPPSVCPVFEMYKELNKPCNFDVCSPTFCTYDARYYVESYNAAPGAYVATVEKTVLSNGIIESFEVLNNFAYLTSSAQRFLLINFNQTNEKSNVVLTSTFKNSAHKNSIITYNDQSFLIADGTYITKFSFGCQMFETCEQVLSARKQVQNFSSCGWCISSGADQAGFGSTKAICSKTSTNSFLIEKCPPLVDCFTPVILNPVNSTTITLSGKFEKTQNWQVTVCGSNCSVKKVEHNSLVCETSPPFVNPSKDCTVFVAGSIEGVDIRRRPSCGYRFEVAKRIDGFDDKDSTIKSSESGSAVPYWVVIVCVIFAVLCCLMVVVLRWCICSRRKIPSYFFEQPWYRLISSGDPTFNHRYGPSPSRQVGQGGDIQYTDEPYPDLSFLVPPEIKIPWTSINKQELIGAGHFGEVYKAFYRHPDGRLDVVAAKTLPVGARNARQFIEEGIRMEVFHHNNVLALIGISFNEINMPIIVTPFMLNGDLLSFLRNADNSPTVRQLLNLAVDIAEGLNYLHQLKFIHRDLAARNCMLDDQMRVKVADFGLSRDVYETQLYLSVRSDTDLPIKWLPPESVERHEFTPKSDVWSYGVTLWEILTRGVEPYAGMSGYNTVQFLKSGQRLAKPTYCPDEIYDLMRVCWLLNPSDRPECGDICVRLPSIIRLLESNAPVYYNMIAPLRPPSTQVAAIV